MLLSDEIGAEIKIGSIGGNILKRGLLRDVNCEFGKFNISFDSARLDYSLKEIIAKKTLLSEGSSTAVRLEGGTLTFKNKQIDIKGINGRITIDHGRVIINSLDFKPIDLLKSTITGEIIRDKGAVRLDLLLNIEPFFKKNKLFFQKASIKIRGPVENISFSGTLRRPQGFEVIVSGDFDASRGILSLGSFIDLAGGKEQAPEGLSRQAKKSSMLSEIELDIKDSHFKGAFVLPEGDITVKGDYTKWPLVETDIVNDHIKIGSFDLSNTMHLTSKVVFKKSDFSHIDLELYTESTILNYYPFDEVEASCWIDRDVVRLTYAQIGDSISATGALSLKVPHKAFFKVLFNDFDIKRFLFISKEGAAPIASGSMSGEIFTQGSIGDLKTKVHFEATGGHIGTIVYENMLLNLKGDGPVLELYDSRLVREDSFLTLDGSIDMSKMGADGFFDDLVINTDPNTIIWNGWDIQKAIGEKELRLSKGIDDRVKVGFTKRMSDETAYEVIKPQDEFGLEYKMPQKDSILQFKTKDKEEFLGVMKKYKF